MYIKSIQGKLKGWPLRAVDVYINRLILYVLFINEKKLGRL